MYQDARPWFVQWWPGYDQTRRVATAFQDAQLEKVSFIPSSSLIQSYRARTFPCLITERFSKEFNVLSMLRIVFFLTIH